jgi:hypothetical protein
MTLPKTSQKVLEKKQRRATIVNVIEAADSRTNSMMFKEVAAAMGISVPDTRWARGNNHNSYRVEVEREMQDVVFSLISTNEKSAVIPIISLWSFLT